jgi:hypothetical protein
LDNAKNSALDNHSDMKFNSRTSRALLAPPLTWRLASTWPLRRDDLVDPEVWEPETLGRYRSGDRAQGGSRDKIVGKSLKALYGIEISSRFKPNGGLPLRHALSL